MGVKLECLLYNERKLLRAVENIPIAVPRYLFSASRKTTVTFSWKMLCELGHYFEKQKNKEFTTNAIREHIVAYKIGLKSRKLIWSKNLVLNFSTPEGARIISACMGDGGRKAYDGLFSYSNSDEINLRLIDESIQKVFGKVLVNKKENNKRVPIIEYPSTVGVILGILGLPKGEKVVKNSNVPEFIFNAGKDVIASFIRQFGNDEATVNVSARKIEFYQSVYLNLPNSIRHKLTTDYKSVRDYESFAPNVLKSMKELLFRAWGILTDGCAPRNQVRVYRDNKNNIRHVLKWRLAISGVKELTKFSKYVGFDVDRKQGNLQKGIASVRRTYTKRGFVRHHICKTALDNHLLTSKVVTQKLQIDMKTASGHLKEMLNDRLLDKTGGGNWLGVGKGRAPYFYTLTELGETYVKDFENNYLKYCVNNFQSLPSYQDTQQPS